MQGVCPGLLGEAPAALILRWTFSSGDVPKGWGGRVGLGVSSSGLYLVAFFSLSLTSACWWVWGENVFVLISCLQKGELEPTTLQEALTDEQ